MQVYQDSGEASVTVNQWWKHSSEWKRKSHQEAKRDYEDQSTLCQQTSDSKIQRNS